MVCGLRGSGERECHNTRCDPSWCAGEGFFGQFASSAAGGLTFNLTQSAGEVATYNFTQDSSQKIPALGTSRG